MFLHLNTSKESVTLNLKSEFGRTAALQLAAQSDLVVESFRPGTLERLGPGVSGVGAGKSSSDPRLHPNFGQTGPYRDDQSDEMFAYAASGTMQVTGLPDREPNKRWNYVSLFLAGAPSATNLLGAVTGAELHGIGQQVDLSIMELLAGSMDRGGTNLLSWEYSGALYFPRAPSARASWLPGGVYVCADGYVLVTAPQNWCPGLCRTLDRPDLLNDPYWVSDFNDVSKAG